MTGLAAPLNLNINRYASFELNLTWKDSLGAPINNSSYHALLQIRTDPNSPNVLFEASTSNSRITLGGANGYILIKITAADTKAMSWDKGVYDLIMRAPNGNTKRLIEGLITVKDGVSQF